MPRDIRGLVKDITPGVSNDEAQFLYELAKFSPLNRVIELGSFVGKSTVAFAAAMHETNGNVLACDYFPKNSLDWETNRLVRDTGVEFWNNLRIRNLDHVVLAIKGDIMRVLPTISGQFGLVFIDGGHEADKVIVNSLWAWHHITSGGYIVWHDYYNNDYPGVKLAVDLIVTKWDKVLHLKEGTAAIKR